MPLTTSAQVIAADVERIVAVLLDQNTDKHEYKAVGAFARARPDREEIQARLEYVLETGRAERFKGYSNEYFVDEFAKGERAHAWRWLLSGFWSKKQAIDFAIGQIESANRLAPDPHQQETLEEAQLEAIAEMSRYYKGDCGVAAALAGVSVFPYVLWRLHDRWFLEFLGCSAIVPPLARRLAGEPGPLPPLGGRPEPPEFPMSVASLFRAIAPHLASHPDLWDLLSRSAVTHMDQFDRDHLKPFIDALSGDPRIPILLHAMCEQIPTGSEFNNVQVLNVYMTHYFHLKMDAALLRRIATEGREWLSCQAIHWLARFYQDDAGVAEFLIERMRFADAVKVRIGAFHCLMLYFGGRRSIPDDLIAQAETETNNIAQDQMRNALAGKQTYSMWPTFDALEKNSSRNEGELFRRQVEVVRQIRSR